MKSKTYQKEGWFILEEESSVFGLDAGNEDKFDTEKNAIFIIENKEEIQNKIDISSKDLTDFFDGLSKDLPEPSKEEIDSGIAKILERTHPETVKSEPSKANKSKKVTFRVLFVAALLSALSFTCLFAVGSRHNINIENGFVTFAKDTVKVVFFDEGEEECIDMKTLLEDLSSHGYENILIPQALYHCKSSVPEYFNEFEGSESNSYVTFEVYNENVTYGFKIQKIGSVNNSEFYFKNLDNAETLIIDDVHIYVFEYENEFSSISFVNDGYDCYIVSEISLSEMINIAETIIKTEE